MTEMTNAKEAPTPLNVFIVIRDDTPSEQEVNLPGAMLPELGGYAKETTPVRDVRIFVQINFDYGKQLRFQVDPHKEFLRFGDDSDILQVVKDYTETETLKIGDQPPYDGGGEMVVEMMKAWEDRINLQKDENILILASHGNRQIGRLEIGKGENAPSPQGVCVPAWSNPKGLDERGNDQLTSGNPADSSFEPVVRPLYPRSLAEKLDVNGIHCSLIWAYACGMASFEVAIDLSKSCDYFLACTSDYYCGFAKFGNWFRALPCEDTDVSTYVGEAARDFFDAQYSGARPVVQFDSRYADVLRQEFLTFSAAMSTWCEAESAIEHIRKILRVAQACQWADGVTVDMVRLLKTFSTYENATSKVRKASRDLLEALEAAMFVHRRESDNIQGMHVYLPAKPPSPAGNRGLVDKKFKSEILNVSSWFTVVKSVSGMEDSQLATSLAAALYEF